MCLFVVFVLCACLQAALAAPSGEYAPERKVHTYDLDITESGTKVRERVVIDEDRNLEIIQVPSHNDVTGATYIHDFNLNLTLRREVGEGRCYLTDLSHDLGEGLQPKPRDMVAAINAPAEGDDSRKIETLSFKWTMGAPVTDEERAAFGPEMRELCEGQTIHRLEKVDDRVTVHEESSGLLHRPARQADGDMVSTTCPRAVVASRCIVKLKNCRYTHLVNCHKKKHESQTRMVINCQGPSFAHIYDRIICCLDCCSEPTRADKIMPNCNTVTKAQVKQFSYC